MTHYILGTNWSHPHAESVRKGLLARGASVLDVEQVLEAMRRSPGLPYEIKVEAIVLLATEKRKDFRWLSELFRCPIISELDLAQDLVKVPMVAVTGTDGKTSTTEMLGHGLRACGKRVELFYNFERSILEESDAAPGGPLDYAVLETWSSELESCERFAPHVSVLLNLEPDHYDHHGNWEHYQRAKSHLVHRQKSGDLFVFNAENEGAREFARRFVPKAVRALGYSTTLLPSEFTQGLFIADGALFWRENKTDTKLFALPAWPDWGRFFLSNRVAALTVAKGLGLSLETFAKSLTGYSLRPHRQQVLQIGKNLQVVNDSKSTNCNSARAALERFASQPPLIWITGGTDKQLPLQEICDFARSQVASVVILGSFPRLETALGEAKLPFRAAPDLKAALKLAKKAVKNRGTILFSPIGASDDLFTDYEDRGAQFVAEAHRLFD